MSRDILQLRIELTEIEPAIWRRIQMPGDCTFWDLHVAIQNAMGWLDCHLHMFHVTDPTTGQPELIGRPDEEGLLEEDIVSGWKRLVTQRLSVAHSRLEYVYDFGDDWQHAVVLEEQLPSVPQLRYPRCIGGARACPMRTLVACAAIASCWRRWRIPTTKSTPAIGRGWARSTTRSDSIRRA